MSHKVKYTLRSLRFNDLSHLIDCLMLFGASIEDLGDVGFRLSLEKQRRQWPVLGFVLIATESQDPLFDFLKFNITQLANGGIRCKTRSSVFLGSAYKKWYRGSAGGGVKVMPTFLDMDDHATMFWLLGSWSNKEAVTVQRYGCPHPPPRWRWATRRGTFVLNGEDRKEVFEWLRERVPEKILR